MLLIAQIRNSRSKAQKLARAELLALLSDAAPQTINGGPLGDQPRMTWIELLGEIDRAELAGRLERTGYFEQAWVLVLIPETEWRRSCADLVRWRNAPYRLVQIFKLDREAERAREPDKRAFAICKAGAVAPVLGYRGSGEDSTRRALPVCDARLLINLSIGTSSGILLDPCAGGGSIVSEAIRLGIRTISADIDPFVRHGLQQIVSAHSVADVCQMPFLSSKIDAIATEPPFHKGTEPILQGLVSEAQRVLRSGGRAALLIAAWQSEFVRQALRQAGFKEVLREPLDRRGTECVVVCAEK